jgi:hypothetical protein
MEFRTGIHDPILNSAQFRGIVQKNFAELCEITQNKMPYSAKFLKGTSENTLSPAPGLNDNLSLATKSISAYLPRIGQ